MHICKEGLTVVNQSSLDIMVSDEVLTEDLRQLAVDKILKGQPNGEGSERHHAVRSGFCQMQAEPSSSLDSDLSEVCSYKFDMLGL